MKNFRVELRQDPETGDWAACAPELPGCASAGKTKEEAVTNIRDAIILYLRPDLDPGSITRVELPAFKYHPNPIATGSIVASNTECCCCGKARGCIYIGPVYAIEEYEACICPWCIADGSAHEKLEASFTDEEGIGAYGACADVPIEVIEEIAYRTPGFSGFQQEQWLTHCGDAAQFLGRAGATELAALGPQAIAAIKELSGIEDADEWQQCFASLDKDGSPTAFIFRCIRCGQLGGYIDSE